MVSNDLVKRFWAPNLSEKQDQLVCRVTVLVLSGLTFLLALTVRWDISLPRILKASTMRAQIPMGVINSWASGGPLRCANAMNGGPAPLRDVRCPVCNKPGAVGPDGAQTSADISEIMHSLPAVTDGLPPHSGHTSTGK